VICRNSSVLAFHLWPTIFAGAPFRLQNICRNGVSPRSRTTTPLPTTSSVHARRLCDCCARTVCVTQRCRPRTELRRRQTAVRCQRLVAVSPRPQTGSALKDFYVAVCVPVPPCKRSHSHPAGRRLRRPAVSSRSVRPRSAAADRRSSH